MDLAHNLSRHLVQVQSEVNATSAHGRHDLGHQTQGMPATTRRA